MPASTLTRLISWSMHRNEYDEADGVAVIQRSPSGTMELALYVTRSGANMNGDKLTSTSEGDDDTLDRNTIYCLSRDNPEADAFAGKLRTAGFQVIREDGSCTFYAPPEGFSSTESLHTEAKLRPLPLEGEVVRDATNAKIVCGGHFSFEFTAKLPLQDGQLEPQTLTIGGVLRTFKVTDIETSDWVRVEITSLQWSISPSMIADGKRLGYFVDCVELKLRPLWEKPSPSCRHAPEPKEVEIEETKILQQEKNGSIQLSLSRNFGATAIGGLKRTRGLEQKILKVPCKEKWLVNADSDYGLIGAYYKYEWLYWNAANGVPKKHEGIISQLPPPPEVSLRTKAGTVDWLWPSTTIDTNLQSLQWEFHCTARAVFLVQIKETKPWKLKKIYQIEPSIAHAGGTKTIELKLKAPPRVRKRLFYLIALLITILALIASKFVMKANFSERCVPTLDLES